MNELNQAIEEFRKARQAHEGLLQDQAALLSQIEAMTVLIKRSEDFMNSCEANCQALIRDLASEPLPSDFR